MAREKKRIGCRLQQLLPLLLVAAALSAWPARADNDKVAFLVQKLRESSFKVRIKAAVMLGRIADQRSVDPLINALSDENYVVRGAAARALGNLGYPLAVGAMDRLLKLADDEEPFVRREAVRTLEKLAGPQSLDALLAALSDSHPRVRLAAVHVLALLKLPGARRAVVTTLGDEDEEVKAEAFVALKGLGRSELKNLLAEALKRNNRYQVQVAAARLVGELHLTGLLSDVADLLIRDDVVPAVKREARETLSAMKDAIVVAKLRAQLESGDRTARDRAIKLLGIQGSSEAVDSLLALLKDEDPFVRRRVVSALGDAGDTRAIPALEFLQNKESDSRLLEQIKRTLRRLRLK